MLTEVGTSRPTCGLMYKDALDHYTGGDPDRVHLFAAGFVSGQAEKVYLGACRAAMFRPSQDKLGMILEIVADVCQRYGLVSVHQIGSQREVWICRPNHKYDVERLLSGVEDSPDWHYLRAWLCGVPRDQVDPLFHMRKGSKDQCD